MNRNNLVSIIMPAYNSSKYIYDSIQSVINQTYKNWELIVVDDASKDNTNDIIKSFVIQDARIRLIRQNVNRGVVTARNLAISVAKGRFIAFLDSDDLWEINKLEIQIDFMLKNKLPFTFTDYEYIDENGLFKKKINCPIQVDYRSALKGNQIGCLTVIIDKDAVGNFDMVNIKHEDYATWLRIFSKGITGYGINKSLAQYRVSTQSLSGNKLKTVAWTWNIYRKSEKLSLLKSFYFLLHHLKHGIRKHYIREILE